jgi:hypothetical protein
VTFGKTNDVNNSYTSVDDTKIPTQVESLTRYADSALAFDSILKHNGSEVTDSSDLARERNLRQMLVWINGRVLTKALEGGIHQAPKEINNASDLRITLNSITDPSSIQKISEAEHALIRPPKQSYTIKKQPSKQVEAAMRRQEETKIPDLTEILTASKIQYMSKHRFNRHISTVLRESAQSLATATNNPVQNKKVSEQSSFCLNQRKKKTQASWQLRDKSIEEDIEIKQEQIFHCKKNRRKWKGKTIVKARRSYALGLY